MFGREERLGVVEEEGRGQQKMEAAGGRMPVGHRRGALARAVDVEVGLAGTESTRLQAPKSERKVGGRLRWDPIGALTQ